jgi:hypothetical protein
MNSPPLIVGGVYPMEASREFTQHLPSAPMWYSHQISSPGTIADRHYLYHSTSYRKHRETDLAGRRITSVNAELWKRERSHHEKKHSPPLPMSNYADV